MTTRRYRKISPAWAWCLAFLAVAWFLVTRWLAVFSEAINWDEFALLGRADVSLRLGGVQGGGRPGLVTIVLIPFVKGCVDSVQAAVHARILWQFLTLAYLAGVYVLVRRWFEFSRHPRSGRIEAAVATALLAFLPAFVTWSVQVRTDQAALAATIWGGVTLMSPRARNAALAGVLFAAGLLCSQKGLYVIGLAGVLFLTASVSRGLSVPNGVRPEISAALRRTGLVALGTAATIGLYLALVPETANLMSQRHLASSFDTMNWYRARLGYRAYTVHASRLWVHWLLLAFLVLWTTRAVLARDRTEAIRLVTGWSVLILGLVVIRIHGSSLPYFLMTAGLFPAVALGLASGPAVMMAGDRKPIVLVGLLAVLLLQSTPETMEMLRGTQASQRETMRLITGSSLAGMRGYNVERALFCAADPKPLPGMFAPQIMQRKLRGPNAFDEFIEEFRRRPIAYIVESYRMQQFPANVRQFWDEHYVPYDAALQVAGFRVSERDEALAIDVIVDGTYRWVTSRQGSDGAIVVGNMVVQPGETLWLAAGKHTVSKADSTTKGSLVLAISAAPLGEAFPFYDPRQVRQIRLKQ